MNDCENQQYERSGRRRMPRWAVVALVVGAIVALLAVAVLLTGDLGGHGPARHTGMAVTR